LAGVCPETLQPEESGEEGELAGDVSNR